jgi:hypothetical protein
MVCGLLTFHNFPGRCGVVNIPFSFAFLGFHDNHLKTSAIAFAAAYVRACVLFFMVGAHNFMLQLQERGQHVSQHLFAAAA